MFSGGRSKLSSRLSLLYPFYSPPPPLFHTDRSSLSSSLALTLSPSPSLSHSLFFTDTHTHTHTHTALKACQTTNLSMLQYLSDAIFTLLHLSSLTPSQPFSFPVPSTPPPSRPLFPPSILVHLLFLCFPFFLPPLGSVQTQQCTVRHTSC